jgi:membrane-associated protein TcaA
MVSKIEVKNLRYCKNCGTQLAPDVNFCRNCGEKNTPIQPIKTGLSSTRSTTEVVKVREPLSTPVKAGIIAMGILIAGLGGVHLYLSGQSKPVKTVEKFEQAIKDNDAKELMAILNNGQDQYAVSEKEVKSYIEYLTEENDFSEISKELRKQAEELETTSNMIAVKDRNGNNIANVKRVGKKFFFYNEYKLAFYPIQLKVGSNLEGTEIWLNGKKITKLKNANSHENIAFLFPGDHVVEGKYKGEYESLETKVNLDFNESFENHLEVLAKFDSTQIVVYSNYDDAILFVNGKSTGKEIGNIESFGPVPTDGSVTLHAERYIDGKTVKTEPNKITDNSTVELLFETEEIVASSDLPEYLKAIGEDDIARFMDAYFASMVVSINSRDVSSYESIFDPEGKALNEFKSYLSNTVEKKGITEEYLGMELVGFEETEGGYNVTTNEEYNIYFGDGTGKRKAFESVFYISLLEDGLNVHTLLKTDETFSEDLN